MIIITAKKKKVDLEDEIEILKKIRHELKNNKIAAEICKEYDFDLDIIDGIPIDFEEDLEASAKTVDSKIILRFKLIDEEFDIIMRYAIHELVHALQHMRSVGSSKHKSQEYLDQKDELEAFQYQVKFDAKERGLDKAKEYVEELVDYHKIPRNKAKGKKRELLNKAI